MATADTPIFTVPFRHLYDTFFITETGAATGTPTGLPEFVGDEANLILKYLIHPEFNQQNAWPLVLYGPAGTGKTSLAMSVVSGLAERSNSFSTPAPEKPIFLSAVDFDRRYRAALEADSLENFRDRLLLASGIVLDDLQKLTGKLSVQNELIKVIDLFVAKQLPVIFTLNQSPCLCRGLSAQLMSRLSGGLSLPVNPPGPGARLQIIQNLARINEIQLTDDALELLVARLSVTVPKLIHFFAQIKVKLNLNDLDSKAPQIDAAALLKVFQKSDQDIEELSTHIIQVVAAEFNLAPRDLKGNSRKQTLVLGRGVAIYLIRTLLGSSFLKIGTFFGNRDHSTIMHAFRKIEKVVADNSNNDAGAVLSIQKLKQRLAEELASISNFI